MDNIYHQFVFMSFCVLLYNFLPPSLSSLLFASCTRRAEFFRFYDVCRKDIGYDLGVEWRPANRAVPEIALSLV